VKFLVDHQLPPALARFIATQGHQAEHVRASVTIDTFG
jgi:predicted nuclease of predicted toxin-antitoxin system